MELQKKPLLIFDSDMDTDCDDAGALAMIYEAVRRGRAELLGIITDVVSPDAAPCCEAFGKFYGIDRPIGTIYATDYPESETTRYVRYRIHTEQTGDRRYNRRLARQIGKQDTDYPSAVHVYRKLLASAEDQSVTILCVGLLTALDALLRSEGDEISPLSGEALLRQKVEKVVSMGYPAWEGINFNWDMDSEGAEHFIAHCPVPLCVSGEGDDVITGSSLSSRFAEEHPLRQAYEIYTEAPNRGRSSWDLIATLYALEPETPLLEGVERGTCCYDPAIPRSYWQKDGKRRDFDVVIRADKKELEAYLERYLTGEI